MDSALDGGNEQLGGRNPDEIPLDIALKMRASGGAQSIMCDTIMPATPSGKIELYSDDLQTRFGYGMPRFQPIAKPCPLH